MMPKALLVALLIGVAMATLDLDVPDVELEQAVAKRGQVTVEISDGITDKSAVPASMCLPCSKESDCEADVTFCNDGRCEDFSHDCTCEGDHCKVTDMWEK
ncbi:uncharacterized protein LOC118418413 isoform X2 [Branchiostoma floridae]|uniref:Uncharacterized protein LOC118418411 isoform X2 n=1 Tax=Branchiostoma floridae TaxID=7739 RepID=A0A9J7LDR7_BRAFL|nr:uncharacterized protein LOC118418411 isoform X2 [Branchiostoma floridae]XP_035680201.1 uncharacterized protein LOC118418411 isoform X2 [Branchiostoma floridae]XP_035680203.1 uncharacterized protein LOC118418413 isoform X2 [Branchiostoma floridae]